MTQINKYQIKVGDILRGKYINLTVIKTTDKTCTTESFNDYGRFEHQRTWNTINKTIEQGIKIERKE